MILDYYSSNEEVVDFYERLSEKTLENGLLYALVCAFLKTNLVPVYVSS